MVYEECDGKTVLQLLLAERWLSRPHTLFDGPSSMAPPSVIHTIDMLRKKKSRSKKAKKEEEEEDEVSCFHPQSMGRA